MRRKEIKLIAGILAIVMILNSAPVMRASAEGVNEEQKEETTFEYEELPEDESLANDIVIQEEGESVAEAQELTENTTETKESLVKVEYLYVESPYLEVPATQNIIVALTEESTRVDSAVLEYVSEEGKVTELQCQKNNEGAYLFSDAFATEDRGIYEATKFKYSIDGTEYEMQLGEIGVGAQFGVNEALPESRSNNVMKLEDSEENSYENPGFVEVNQEESGITANVSEALAEAMSEVPVPISGEEAKKEDIVIVLDPGHDSTHAGTSASGVKEEVVSLKIAQYCKAVLDQYSGVQVYMTREGAECPSPNTKNNITDIKERTEWAKTKGADVFISFHINSSEASGAHGAEVYYPKGNADAQDLAQEILKDLADLGLKNRGDKESEGYAVVKYSKENGFPGLIIEHAFVSNSSDVKWFQSEENLKKLGEADAQGIIRHYDLKKGSWEYTNGKWKWKDAEGNYVVNSWKYIDAQWYFFDASGYMLTGWQDIYGQTYYFNTSGEMVTGWRYIEEICYYFNESGHLLKGEHTIDGTKWYLDKDTGAWVHGWQYVNGKWYYHNYNGYLQTGWQYVNGKWYYLNSSGEMQTGWQYVNGAWYYLNSSGEMQTGWLYLNGAWYYLKSSGQMLKGWQIINGAWYYLNSSGVMQTGWQIIDNRTYYLLSSGEMVTGWQYIDDICYYFNGYGHLLKGEQTINGVKWYLNQETGAWRHGWQRIDEKWYYHNYNGYLQTGWQYVGGAWYYMNSTGVMQTGWQYINRTWYYLNSLGVMQTGWQYVGGKWYYLNSSGAMQTGWQYVGGRWYYLNSSGAMQTGWQTIGGKQYYLTSSGAMVTGWTYIEGICYYFNSSGHLLKGEQVLDGTKWYLDKETGAWRYGWHSIDGKRYYYNYNGYIQTGWQYIDGTWYYMNAAGIMQTNWQYIGGKWYYLDGAGVMQTGWQKVDGIWYYMESSGEWNPNPSSEPPREEEDISSYHMIEGESTVTVDQMVKWYKKSLKKFPAEALKPGGVDSLEQFCQMYYEEAQAENMKVEVAFAQSMHETGWLQYGNNVEIGKFNFAGLGATGNGAGGADFSGYGEEGVRMGIRAHIQHLKAYANKEKLVNDCVDPRFNLVKRGSAKYVEWLGKEENPNGAGWATDAGYGNKIVKLITDLKKA